MEDGLSAVALTDMATRAVGADMVTRIGAEHAGVAVTVERCCDEEDIGR